MNAQKFIILMIFLVIPSILLGVTYSQDRRGFQVNSYIVVDFHSKKILSAKDINKRVQVASLTKIATSMVVLDWADATNIDLGNNLIIPQSASLIGGPNQLGLIPGDQMSIRDALYSAILGSNNWAAEALAYHVGRDLLLREGKRGDPVKEFVKNMNALARNNGAKNTKFTNPHGMDHLGKPPFSCASDVARLAIYAMNKASFSFICSQKQREVSVLKREGLRKFLIKNTNKNLGIDDIDGIKTGQTSKAGPCLAVAAEKQALVRELADGKKQVIPRRLIVVVLGAQDRFAASRSLLLRGWQKFEAWNSQGRQVLNRNEFLSTIRE
ncbi:MAG: hypothetical protein CMO46_10050 [Verrucomicrobiales bacterium]|nr:hypothetical protein [Verrucomicrobiales bacterium]